MNPYGRTLTSRALDADTAPAAAALGARDGKAMLVKLATARDE